MRKFKKDPKCDYIIFICGNDLAEQMWVKSYRYYYCGKGRTVVGYNDNGRDINVGTVISISLR